MKNILLSTTALLIVGCGSSGGSSSSAEPIAVYNQAYTQNFAPDSISHIIENANNAYVLLDTFNAGVGEHIGTIKANGNQVGGYISVGTGETYRSDFYLLESYLTSKAWPEWPDEYFVSETTTGILEVMKSRIDTMYAAGVQWVEFDNMDWLNESSRQQYNLTTNVSEAKAYVNALCDYTQSKGMKCMAKNTVDGFSNFDGVTYESFSSGKNWWDNNGMRSFISSGKPVIIVHYNESNCDNVYEEYKSFYKSEGISFICEDNNLRAYRHYN